MSLATVDFGAFLGGTEDQRRSAATTLVDSFRSTGFVKLINHGIPLEMIQEAEAWVCLGLCTRNQVQI
jgi:isopenicillin N synthase-like dioxygenase